MKRLCFFCVLVVTLVDKGVQETRNDYLARRLSALTQEANEFLGSNLTLSENEQQVNNKLMSLKQQEINSSVSSNIFLPSMHFFHSKPYIESSKVFWFLRKMPKGMHTLLVFHLTL